MISRDDVLVPLTVPDGSKDKYISNYLTATQNTGMLMLFAGDQKFEHLNDDYYGDGIDEANADPEHMFKIASKGEIGVFATQLGLVARYGKKYTDIPYLIKINSKTHLVQTDQRDPLSEALITADQVADFKDRTDLDILGIGYTIYLGSEYESDMLTEAQQAILDAHANGLIVVLWIYPRGKAVLDEKNPHLIAGAAGVAACLGADFVKVNFPKPDQGDPSESLMEASKAAGLTKLVCAGGSNEEPDIFLKKLHDQIHKGGASGNATGRNIHQRPLEEAVRLTKAINAITVGAKSVEEALEIFNDKK